MSSSTCPLPTKEISLPLNSSPSPIDVDALMQNIEDPRYFGNFVCLFYRNHTPLITIGPQCTFSAFLKKCIGYLWVIASILITAISILAFYFSFKEHPFYLGLGIALLLLFNGSYAYTALTNPGLPDRDLSKYSKEFITELIQANSPRFCKKCKIVKSLWRRTVHCNICDICIEGYDHHCVWTSKCVGQGNLIMFGIFNVSVAIILIYIGVSSILTTKQ